MKRFFFAMGAVAAGALAVAGCSNSACYDCGTCGIAGPTDVDQIHDSGAGVDQDGVPVVRIYLWHKGGCKGSTDDPYFVRYDGGKVTVVKGSSVSKLDQSAVSTKNDKYVWSDRDLEATVGQKVYSELDISFTSGGTTTTTTCVVKNGVQCGSM